MISEATGQSFDPWLLAFLKNQVNENVKVEVRLFANLAKLLPPGSQKKRAEMTIRKGATINDLLDKLNIPPKVTNIIMVNGIHQNRETELKEGDVVSVFPPIAGG